MDIIINCPRCGSDNPATGFECRSCGTVFSKFRPVFKSTGDLLCYSSIVLSTENSYSRIIQPIATAIQFVQHIFRQVVDMIWQRLTGDDTIYPVLGYALSGLIFSVLSVLMYMLNGFEDFAVLTIFAMWIIDYLLARRDYRLNDSFDRIYLYQRDGYLFWSRVSKNNQQSQMVFSPRDIRDVKVQCMVHYGGAFHGEMGYAWQIKLRLVSGSDLLIYEHMDLDRVFKKARMFAGMFQVLVKFADSEGTTDYADMVINERIDHVLKKKMILAMDLVGTSQDARSASIFSRWSFRNSLMFAHSVIREFGFFMFLIFLSGVMVAWGGALVWFFGPSPSIDPLHWRFPIYGIINIFTPESDWKDIVEITVAMGVMFYGGWKLSHPKRIDIDVKETKLTVRDEEVTRLPTRDVEHALFVKKPYPCILVLGRRETAEITDLQSDDEFRAMLHHIEDSIARFQGRDEKRELPPPDA